LVDIKGLGSGESSDFVSFHAEQEQLKPNDRRAVKVQVKEVQGVLQGRQGPRQQVLPYLLQMKRLARSNPFFCRSGQCQASTSARFSGSVLACLKDLMTSERSSRAIVRSPSWIVTTTRSISSTALGAFRSSCGHFHLERIAVASSLACSRPPPAPRARLVTPVLTSRTAAFSISSTRTPDAAFRPVVRGGNTETSMPGISFSSEMGGFC